LRLAAARVTIGFLLYNFESSIGSPSSVQSMLECAGPAAQTSR